MKTYTIGTSWKRLLAVSSVLGVLLTGYSASTTAGVSTAQELRTCKAECAAAGDKECRCYMRTVP